MSTKWIAALSLLALAGCRSLPQEFETPSQRALNARQNVNRPSPEQHATTSNNAADIRQVSFHSQEAAPPIAPRLPQGGNEPPMQDAAGAPQIQQGTLAGIEQVALATNPAVQQAQAEVEALRGKLTQVGLPPNPTVGVMGDDINEDNDAGKYGVFFGREIVRGNKLGLSRSVVCAEIQAAEQRLATIQQKLLTDVRQRYYELLVAQEKVQVAAELVAIAQNALDTSRRLFEAKESPQTSVLQSEIELVNARVIQQQAENERLAAMRKLAGLLGEETLPVDHVAGDLDAIGALEDFEQSFDVLINNSPEMASLFAEVEQARRQLQRECVEAIPNVTWQTNLLYDTVFDDVVAGFQVGLPIPTINRNQGAIYQARQQIVAAERRVEKQALDLRERLASAYESYLDAHVQAEVYRSDILPKAKENLQLITQGFSSGEIDFLQLLTAQRTYAQTKLDYLNSVRRLWQEQVNIRGLLLSGSMK
jgi:cobalt-zinc-cadmium efflux system outer membrane protein